jgi:hypothetical protein
MVAVAEFPGRKSLMKTFPSKTGIFLSVQFPWGEVLFQRLSLFSFLFSSGRGDARIAEPWIRHCEETLEGVKKALAIDDEPSTFAGDLIRASPNQSSRFEKSLG